jgi:type I restriction enzyme S subunit
MSTETKNKLVPRFRFPEFQNAGEWEVKRVGDVAVVYQPKTISQTDLKDKGYLVYGANGVIGYYDQYNHETSQIAIACRGSSCGTVNFTEPKSWITGNAMVVNTDGYVDIDKKFLFYQLFASSFTYLITGSGQPQITGNVKKHKVSVPSLPEQEKIASCLSSIDEVITGEQQKLKLLKQHKKGLLQNLFPQEGETVPKLRFKEFENSGEWEEKKLIQIATYVNDKMPIENLSINSYISTENLLADYAGVTLASKLPSSGNFTKYQKGDILVSNIRPYLKKVWFADKDGACSNDVIVIRSGTFVSDKLLSYLLKNDAFISYIMKGAEGVKMPRGDKDSIKEYPILYPKDKTEQQKIASCLSSLDDLITAQTQKIEQLQRHKKGLLQGLFPNMNEQHG